MDSSRKTTSTIDSTPPKVKTLQQVSASKTIETLENDADAIGTFLSLGEEEKQVLFPHIWEELLRLRAAERRIPAADHRLYFYDHNENFVAGQDSSYNEDAIDEADSKWNYFEANWRVRGESEEYDWYNIEEGYFELMDHDFVVTADPKQPIASRWDQESVDHLSKPISTLISSQLLFYRLVDVFHVEQLTPCGAWDGP